MKLPRCCWLNTAATAADKSSSVLLTGLLPQRSSLPAAAIFTMIVRAAGIVDSVNLTATAIGVFSRPS